MTVTFAPETDTRPLITVEPLTRVQRLLLRAADLLEMDGWSSGSMEDALGRRCAVGALRYADHLNAHRPPEGQVYVNALHRLIETTIGRKVACTEDPESWVISWNDGLGRGAGFSEVVRAMRKAAL